MTDYSFILQRSENELDTPLRLDVYLSKMIPDTSRSKIKNFILTTGVKVNKKLITKANFPLKIGDEIELINFKPISTNPMENIKGQAIKLDIKFEDAHLLVINKPAGLVVHPGAGVNSGTLMHALSYHYPKSKYLNRYGLVHRLDKDTSGLLIIAKTELCQQKLITAIFERQVSRIYEAIVHGNIKYPKGNQYIRIKTLIGRHPRDRKKMAVLVAKGKVAITNYKPLSNYRNFCHVRLKLETGRTHQIRVHMQHLKHGVVGDKTYKINPKLLSDMNPELISAVKTMTRQALHATRLELEHPITGNKLVIKSKPPVDMQNILDLLVKDWQNNFATDCHMSNSIDELAHELIYLDSND